MTLRILITICMVLMGTTATAESNKLDISCCSYHFNRDANYNEQNWGVVYKYYPTPEFHFQVGTYRNSEYGRSTIIGVGQTWKLSKDFDFTLSGGVVTGYVRGILPYVIPTFSYKDMVHLHTIPLTEGGFGLSFTIARW